MNINIELKGSYYVAVINGDDCQDWESFFKNIGITFKFPEYYGQNLAAFEDCINDLSWIRQDNYLLIINESSQLLSKGIQEDDQEYLKNLFDKISENWKLGPGAEGDDETRKVSVFKVIYN